MEERFSDSVPTDREIQLSLGLIEDDEDDDTEKEGDNDQ